MERKYEWDEPKRLSNLEKHEIDFSTVEYFEWNSAVVVPSNRQGERRFAATGYIGNRLFTVIYTMRGDLIRVISMRKASRKEIRDYAEA